MKNVLLIGLGRFGMHVAAHLYDLGHQVMAVDTDEDRVNKVLPYVTNAQIGDSTDADFLRSLGVDNYDVCIVTIGGNFQNSLETASLLEELGAKKVVARAERDVQAKFLLRNGADEVVYPERDIAEKTAVRFSSNNILDFIQVSGEYSIFQIPVPADWVDRSISSLDIRRKHAVNILAVEAKDGHIDAMPGADHVFHAGDKLLILGKSRDVFRLTDRA